MDTAFFIFSKLGWLFLRPETVLILLFAVALLLLRRGRVRAAGAVLKLTLAATGLIAVFPIGYLLLSPLEHSYTPTPDIENPGGIIVLGGAEDIGPPRAGSPAGVTDAGDRLIATFMLAQRFPEALVLYTGGKATVTPANEGEFEIGPDILRGLGLPETRLIVEGRSRTTAENAVLSRNILPQAATGPWILVTSAFHMPRAMAVFCTAGWSQLIAYPTDYRSGDFWPDVGWNFAANLDLLNLAVKEWIGLLAYRISGRIDAAFPATC